MKKYSFNKVIFFKNPYHTVIEINGRTFSEYTLFMNIYSHKLMI